MLIQAHATSSHSCVHCVLTASGRCYAASTLDGAQLHYTDGTTYCTRQAQLVSELDRCLSNPKVGKDSDEPPSHEMRAVVNAQGVVTPPARDIASSPSQLASVTSSRQHFDVAPELDWWPGVGVGELTIPAVNTSGWLSSSEAELVRVQGWKVECIDDFSRHKLNNYTGNVSRRKVSVTTQNVP